MKYEVLPTELFELNRRRFVREMEPGSIAIFHSNDLMPRSGDSYFPFRQNADLFYLSGLDQEETVVVLFPDCVKEGFRELAFIKRTNDHIRRWEGEKYTKEQARAVSGIQRIHWLDEMDGILHELILLARNIYVNLNEHDHFRSEVPTRNLRFARQLKERYPAHQFQRAQPVLKKLAMIKTTYEVEVIRQSIDITGKAFNRVLKMVRPEVAEFEIEAEITHEFLRNRANGHAYEPIIASGANSCVLHYVQNNRVCADGDLLLLDFGAEYANYAADLSRTIPVSGRFTRRQRAVYDSVLSVLKAARQMLVPGVLLEEYHKEVGKLMESELVGLGLLDAADIKNQDKNFPAYKRYFMHGTSHHLGLDVHDRGSRYDPIQAGMVFTCEPGIYIPEEDLGIRLENDILVTDHGPIDLMAEIPIEAEEIEELMNMEVVKGV
ncbi:MAG: aminopeptidase P family protein [Saprospiraceae bacterium]|nr:aminopeptidase P family protein [Saprospiraceae bacterium]MCB0623814.1 aminopeptidase P family protein [Saprospiraceae bacterium]MCB0675137.1 aminopeptidase P family protein [Saprospiraceae bacterium]MCB0679383.1 aminopeptidase P family protein [Saprospiraceae bacterium]